MSSFFRVGWLGKLNLKGAGPGLIGGPKCPLTYPKGFP